VRPGRPPPWWRTHFDDVWFQLHDPLFPAERSRTETAGIIELLGLPVGARVLDAPCGWGRHVRLLREAGFDAWGADLSLDLLRRAVARRRGAARAGWAAADLRALPFADASFDGVINVFTSLGIFGSDRDDLRALKEARRVLAPGGPFLLETMHRDEVVREYAERDAWRLPDGTRVDAERRFDPVTGVSHENWRWRRGRESGERSHALRLRTATEIARLVHRAGFRTAQWFGGWAGEPFTHRSASLIVVARAPGLRLPDRAARR
jgi:ubiquinone/menaquinone biosynthesis C-methylase UbiE